MLGSNRLHIENQQGTRNQLYHYVTKPHNVSCEWKQCTALGTRVEDCECTHCVKERENMQNIDETNPVIMALTDSIKPYQPVHRGMIKLTTDADCTDEGNIHRIIMHAIKTGKPMTYAFDQIDEYYPLLQLRKPKLFESSRRFAIRKYQILIEKELQNKYPTVVIFCGMAGLSKTKTAMEIVKKRGYGERDILHYSGIQDSYNYEGNVYCICKNLKRVI